MKPIFNTLEFDGINSLEQGVFITGESVYNAPERDVESVEIAGRSGDYLLDKGRWKNIDVTYTCGCFGEDQDEFAKKIRNFRNLLASRYGYHRLVDSYNPEEYRLGVFKNPVDVDSQSMKRAGEFDVTFNCKPQRYLMSGETEQVVTSGEKLYNPTPFDSNPLLAVKGYGTIEFNGYTIEIDDGFVGTLKVIDGVSHDSIPEAPQTYNNSVDYSSFENSVNTGDDLTIDYIEIYGYCSTRSSSVTISSVTPSDISHTSKSVLMQCRLSDLNFSAFPASDETQTQTATMQIALSNGSTTTVTVTLTATNKPTGVIDISASLAMSPDISQYLTRSLMSYSIANVSIDSTISRIGDPTYIDCDLGDAYMIKDGTYVGLNKYIDLGSDLPTLASGNNEITFDSTITELKITPRFWIL